MTDREEHANLPPIPDGGLSESMPEWLRQPPAWRTLPAQESIVTEPEDAAELPEPETSPIDPREFLTDDDLPRWLHQLGAARERVPTTNDASRAVAADRGHEAAGRAEAGTAASRFVPTSPPAPVAGGPGGSGDPRPTSPQPDSPASSLPPVAQAGWIVALLASLLVVAVGVIVVLMLT